MSDEFLSFKWKSVRVVPCSNGKGGFDNSVEMDAKSKFKITSLEEWIEKELVEQKAVFRHLGINQKTADHILIHLRQVYESAGAKE